MLTAIALTLAQFNDWIIVPVRFVQVLDSSRHIRFFPSDDVPLNENSAKAILAQVNTFYAPAKVRFDVIPEFTFENLTSDYLSADIDPIPNLGSYSDQTQRPPQTGRTERNEEYRKMSIARKMGLCIYMRSGLEYAWNLRQNRWEPRLGFSRGDREYVRVASKDPRVWAHELGHLFGLPHTCREGVDAPKQFSTRESIDQELTRYAKANPDRDPFDAFDNDSDIGVTDTPPDPGPSFWNVFKTSPVTLQFNVNGSEKSVTFDRNNIMHAQADKGGFSTDQMSLIRESAKFWKNGLPRNERDSKSKYLEFEGIRPTERPGTKTLIISGSEESRRVAYFDLAKGEQRSFKFTGVAAGKYKVSISGIRGSDHGTAELSLNEGPVTKVDWFTTGDKKRPSRMETGWISIGEVEVKDGNLTITFSGSERNKFSVGNMISADALELKPI